MNPDKMTPEQLAEFCNDQNRTYKVEFTGGALQAFMADFNSFREEAADEILEASEYKEAREVLTHIMSM
jgi:hypothetical protein